jgi:hypothetical protein
MGASGRWALADRPQPGILRRWLPHCHGSFSSSHSLARAPGQEPERRIAKLEIQFGFNENDRHEDAAAKPDSPWTVFDLLASGLSGRSIESWLELARTDDLVYVDCNDAAQYAEVLAISQGRLVRHFLQDEEDSSGHVNIGTLPEEGRKRFDDWVDVVVWVETDSDKILRPSHGWLWIHEANWHDA